MYANWTNSTFYVKKILRANKDLKWFYLAHIHNGIVHNIAEYYVSMGTVMYRLNGHLLI